MGRGCLVFGDLNLLEGNVRTNPNDDEMDGWMVGRSGRLGISRRGAVYHSRVRSR